MSTAETMEITRNRGGLADEVCRKIADEIVLGNFAPGSRLDEVTLSERFKVSRTPVREALKQLAIMGLVEYRPNRGSIVAAMSTEQLDQMFEAIGELEATAMQSGDMNRYDAVNLELHTTIIQGCHNPVLIDMAMSLRHRISPFRRTQFRNVERMGESFEEHSVIVEAILSHDVITTYREMRTHLLSARSATSRAAPVWASPASATNSQK